MQRVIIYAVKKRMAIAIKKENLYEENKAKAEKKYEEQQQQELEKQRIEEEKKRSEEEKRKLLAEEEAKKQAEEEQQQSLKLDELKYNQLILAIKDNKAEEAESLVKELNCDMLSKIDANGNTALTLAAYKGLEKVCELLISKTNN
ncbi:hypothetical protein REIP_0990 [Rickettsia endosymbiont of Ixodes pacificus]|nr:hypothetical protein REIP_0990 [Rickettsia endosymbiont of Ixodes pacificus]